MTHHPAPFGAFAVRIYGRRWLRVTPAPKGPALGWRGYTWTSEVADAGKYGSAMAAEIVAMSMRGCGVEVVDLSGGAVA